MFQTIPEFLKAPFGEPSVKQNDYEKMYQSLVKNKKIRIHAYCQSGDIDLVHLKVGSETNKGEDYDVIFLFFREEGARRGNNLRSSYVKFFSNSPSFIYQYAAIYKKEGYLIDLMVSKMDSEYMDVLPKHPPKISYDKSIYAACRYMEDNKLNAYSVFFLTMKKKSEDKFLRGIKDFDDVKSTQEIKSLEKKIEKEVKTQKKQPKKGKKTKSNPSHSIKPTKRVTAKKSTVSSKSGVRVVKAKRSTKKTRKR